jgi:Dipeptidyl peptidase IV (DPP IV) N-terminal region./Prolyl oligopeptidase family.
MTRTPYILIFFLILSSCKLFAQGELKDYQEAEKWLWNNIESKIYNSNINPNWIGKGDSLWYSTKTRKGTEYVLVDIKNKKQQELFDHKRMSEVLSSYTSKELETYDLKLKNIKFKNQKELDFELDTILLSVDLVSYNVSKRDKPKKYTSQELVSPDKEKIAFIKDYNLFLKSGDEKKQLTTDGNEELSYGTSISWYFVRNESKNQPMEYEIDAYWSPDSRYLICTKYNRKHTQKLFMYKSKPKDGFRAEVYSYERPIAGDKDLTRVSYVIFDTETGKTIDCDLPENANFLEYGFQWKSNTKAYTLRYYRGYQKRELIEVDVETGKSRTIVSETADTYVDPNMHIYKVNKETNDVIWSSEKDGWHHIYRYDYASGELKNQITKGEYVVREICKVDSKKKKIYFRANGNEKGDPYYTYLYSINFDGNGMKLLSPENAYHTCNISPNGKYVFDNYSRVDLPDHFVVRSAKNGKTLMNVAKTDIEDIIKMGWKAPEMYTVKGRDNKTDIYGVIFRPFKLDASKSYPVIDGTYSGPQTIRTPKTFRRGLINMDVPMAQIGFVVVTVDGLGSAFRSKKFHDFSYKNLGDIGAPDHIKAIKDLAKKYPYMDVNNVGIYGHSAGGYDATHALLTHPDFYKVGVSSAGNHDHRSAKAWWPELYMGFPAEKHYDEQSNFFLADKLEGKLLMVHGNMDNNVNPAASIRMADEFIKANKDFELILLPGKDHGTCYYDKYFIRKRWDFFVNYLMHKQAPKEFKIN